MAGKDWSDLDLSNDEVKSLTEALKKDEFRKLLVEYAEEINDPENRKLYQNDIIQLEAERGVECTFVNPEPGFVIKTSVDGKKKAFINICQNANIAKPSSKPFTKDNTKGLNWSIPYSQSPGREDHDKKRNRCIVYDVVFHPDTLRLAESNIHFRKMVVDTALSAIEDSYNVSLDKKNVKFPKLKFKGLPYATVIRKKSAKPVELSEEELEFQEKIKYPSPPPENVKPQVKDFTNKPVCKEKYTVPNYIIKHRTGIELEEFTGDRHCKINTAIPKELVVEVNLPLLNSTNQVTLDVMEKSIHVLSDKPVKYKLDIQLPYNVSEENGSAKFDKDKRILIVTLPVKRSNIMDMLREDSGVESDFGDRGDDSSPVGSIDGEETTSEETPPDEDKSVINESYRTTEVESSFLDDDKHYVLPTFVCNTDENAICFVLNVKNVDPASVKKVDLLDGFHTKFSSVGSGFFPISYAFLVKFKEGSIEEDSLNIEVWDNNVTIQMQLKPRNESVTSYFVGVDENSVTENYFDEPVNLESIMQEIKDESEKLLTDDTEMSINVLSANVEEVVIDVIPAGLKENPEELCNSPTDSNPSSEESEIRPRKVTPGLKCRAHSESSGDEIMPMARKSILKNRINRSLSESDADYLCPSSYEGTCSGSDSCIPEEDEEGKDSKKTVRFSETIHKQTFRANSSILGQRRKNQKRTRNKRKALERRASESENSEGEERERERERRTGPSSEDDEEFDCDVASVIVEEGYEFKSDLIFDLDM